MSDGRQPTRTDDVALRRAGWLAVAAAALVLGLRVAAFLGTWSLAVLAATLDPALSLVAAVGTLLGVVGSRRPADEDRPFGYRKLEFIAVGVRGGLALCGAAVILYADWHRLSVPARLHPPAWALLVFAASMVINVVVAQRLREVGERLASPALAAAGRHARLDVIAALVVSAALLGMMGSHRLWIDTVVSVVLSLQLAGHALSILRQAAHGLMDTASGEVRQQVAALLEARRNGWVVGFHDVRCRDAGGYTLVDFHVQFAEGASLDLAHALAESLETEIASAVGPAKATAHLETAEQVRADREFARPQVSEREQQRRRASRLSLGVAVGITAFKLIAAVVTGSAAVLSDALESIVNVAAATFAVYSVRLARSGSDESHPYGHHKIEFLAAGFEGALISLAAALIMLTAVPRLIDGAELENLDSGLVMVLAAALVNAVLGAYLVRSGKRLGSLTLEADGHHVLTDVWTSAGVLAGLIVVKLTGWTPADPLAAILLACYILYTGSHLIARGVRGVLDSVDPETTNAAAGVLDAARTGGRILGWHKLRVRDVDACRFIEVHIQLAEGTSLAAAHAVSEELEAELQAAVAPAEAIVHAEPATELDRA